MAASNWAFTVPASASAGGRPTPLADSRRDFYPAPPSCDARASDSPGFMQLDSSSWCVGHKTLRLTDGRFDHRARSDLAQWIIDSARAAATRRYRLAYTRFSPGADPFETSIHDAVNSLLDPVYTARNTETLTVKRVFAVYGTMGGAWCTCEVQNKRSKTVGSRWCSPLFRENIDNPHIAATATLTHGEFARRFYARDSDARPDGGGG